MTFESMQEHMFGLFYVLTEGADGSNDGSKVFSMLLLTIDMLQVVRTLGTIRFGWTVESQALLRWFDLIALITDQLRRWVPYVCFYVLAVVLVIAAMADAIYVVKLFRDGVLAVIWPLRVLRLLVASIVTIVFTTVLDWLLYPVDCSAEPMSLAAWFHGNGSACTPFGMPEMFIAIPTILLAALFIIFSVGTNVFAFNLDPISRQPLAICTGRVEAAWTLFKVAAVLLPFLSEGLSPLASSIIISLFAARVFWYHLRKLPFQCGYSNKLRGGIHAHVLWLCLSGVATSSVSPGWEGRQTLEWVLIAISPLAFVAGVAIVWWRIHTMDRFLNRLHAEYEVSLLDNESASEFGDRKRGGGQGRSRNNEASAFMEGAQSVKSTFSAVDRPKSRSAYEAFFDTEWEVRRAFSTGGGGYVCCRRLLARRDEEDLPFLNFLLGKAIVEHPDCLDLLLFQLVVLRFIFRDTKQANDQQKKILDNKGIRLDRAFHLYAVIRRATQDSVSTSLGQGGSLNAVNLMEFESKMTTARKSHQTCLSLMKKFWNLVLKVEKSGSSAYGRPSPAAIEDMVHCVNDYEVAIEDAKSEYRWLMEKFPESTSVILSYAHFTDTVINDIKAATKLHTLAAVLENEGLNPDEEQDQAMADGVSSVSSENDARSNNFKFMQSWRSDIVGMEFATLRALQTRVMVCVFFILIISSVGFIMMDLVLFSAAAQENVRLIDASGLFRALAVNSVFWLRTLMMAAHSGNSAAAATVTLNNDVAMQKLMKDHAKNFKLINAEDVETFYHSDRTIYTPAVNGWRAGAMNFWNFGTEFGRMSRLASAIPLGEMANNDYTLSQTSEEKRSVMFVHESVFREAVPFFSEMVRIYESKVTEFGSTATTLTVIDAIINALLNIILIVMTLKTVRVITLVQPEVVACRLALSLPRSTGKKLYAYYKAELQKLTALGDEQAEKDQLMAEEDPETTQKGSGEGLQDAMLAIKVGRTSSNGSADSARVPTIDATKIPSPPNDLAGMEPHGGSIVGPGEDSSDQAFSISKHLTNERRTLGAAVSLNLGTPTNALASGGGSRLKSALKRNPSVEYGSFERSQSDPSRGQAAAAPPSPSGGFPAASSVTAVNLGRAVERYSSMDDKVPSRAAAVETAGVHLRSSIGYPDAEGADIERSDLNHSDIDRSDERRSGSDASDAEASDMDRSDVDHSASDASAHEQDSSLPQEGERVSVAGGNFGATGGVASRELSSAARPASPLVQALGSPDSEGNAKEQKMKEEDDEREEEEVEGAAGLPKKIAVSAPVSLREVDPEVETDVIKSVISRQSIFNRSSTYIIVLFALFTISICSVVVPWRFVGQMVNLGPTSNHAAYRRCLVKSCAHLTRELVLNDGFSRMTQGEIAGTLNGILAQLRERDEAVRRGNLLRVREGADQRSLEHNAVMYNQGCPWKKDGNCSTPDYPTSGTAGVFALSLMFMESVETVLETYGGPEDKWIDTFGKPRDVAAADAVASTITYDGSRDSLLDSDKAVHFVLQGFSGDIFKGYGLVLGVLADEMSDLLGSVHFELRLLFGVYSSLLFFGFFVLLFRRTIAASYEHTERARDFVQMLPTHMLTRGELELLRDHFCDVEDE